MLSVKFFVSDGSVYGFEIRGHAGLDNSGKDILCASVSSAAFLTVNTLTDIIGEKVDCSLLNDGYMKAVVHNLQFKSSSDLLKGFECHIRSLANDYPKNLKVIYGGVNNA